MSFIKQLKQIIDDNTKHSVFGYIRRIEKSNHFFCAIPVMIHYLCLQYYFYGEYFQKCGDDIIISDDHRSIEKKADAAENWSNTSYGNMWFESSIDQTAEWIFKIDKMPPNVSNCFMLGFRTADHDVNAHCFIEEELNESNQIYYFADTPGDSIHSSAGLYEFQNLFTEWADIDTAFWQENDEFTVTLDTHKRVIQFKAIRGSSERIYEINFIKRSRDIKYKLVISLKYPQTKIRLIDFKYDNDTIEIEENIKFATIEDDGNIVSSMITTYSVDELHNSDRRRDRMRGIVLSKFNENFIEHLLSW